MKRLMVAVFRGLALFLFVPLEVLINEEPDKKLHCWVCLLLTTAIIWLVPAKLEWLKGLLIIGIIIGAIVKEEFVNRMPDYKDLYYAFMGAFWATMVNLIIKGVV